MAAPDIVTPLDLAVARAEGTVALIKMALATVTSGDADAWQAFGLERQGTCHLIMLTKEDVAALDRVEDLIGEDTRAIRAAADALIAHVETLEGKAEAAHG